MSQFCNNYKYRLESIDKIVHIVTAFGLRAKGIGHIRFGDFTCTL